MMFRKNFPSIILLILAGSVTHCSQPARQSIGSIERLDPALDALLDTTSKIEVLADGFVWSEGPVWSDTLQALLFSDVPENKIYQWSEKGGLQIYLTPSGYTGSVPRGGEPGSNGLLIRNHQLYLAQHGDRRIARMEADLFHPQSAFTAIADKFEGKRLNSPNDLVMDRQGNVFFTDPPYGLLKNDQDSSKETAWQGVYRVSAEGKVRLLTDSLTRPNGIALSPDEGTLFVANSDPEKPRWYAYELKADSVAGGRIFYDASREAAAAPGSPDGMKMHPAGYLIASGPGGIMIFTLEGKVIGRIRLPASTANCGLDTAMDYLYITADNYLLRVRLKD